MVDEKLRYAGAEKPLASAPGRQGQGAAPPLATADAPQGQDRPYVPGSKALKITEREINGLLNANTDLGQSVRLEFAKDAVNAYVAVPIPKDVPLAACRT